MVVYTVSIPFVRAELAEMVHRALAVDTELREDVVKRTYRVEGNVFHVQFSGRSCKTVRTCVSSFFDMLILAVKTAEKFDTAGK